MALGIATTIRNNMLNQIRDAIDGGGGAGTIKIYTGTRPATGAALSGNTLLGTLTCSDPCAAAASGGVLTFNSITQDAAADATGTATWARIEDSAAAFVCDASVGTSGADINLSSVSITAGGPISITSATITAPNA